MKGNNANATIKYDEAKVSEAQALLNEIKNDLSEVDNTLYDAVMKISNANGIEFVEVDDSAIDMRMPERLMTQCREDTKNISDTINNQVRAIESFMNENSVSAGGDTSSNVQTGNENVSGVTAEQGESKMMIKGPDGKLIEVSEDDLKRMTSNGGGLNINTTQDTTPQTSSVTTPSPTTAPLPTTTAPSAPAPTTAPRTFPTNPQTSAPASTAPITEAPSNNKDNLPRANTIPKPNQVVYAGPSYFEDTNPVNPSDHLADIKVPTNQVVYAGPSYFNDTNPVNPNGHLADIKVPTNQVVYAGPSYFENQTTPVTIAPPASVPKIQVLYAGPPDSITNPPTTPTVPIFDNKKGDDLGTIIINNDTINNTQPISNNPITNTDIVNTTSAIQERVSDNALSQHASPIFSNLDNSVDSGSSTGYTDSTPQYSSIPETGVGMKDSFGDYITPAAIGAAAGIAGMIAAKAMRKDKEEETEE